MIYKMRIDTSCRRAMLKILFDIQFVELNVLTIQIRTLKNHIYSLNYYAMQCNAINNTNKKII